MRTPTTLFAVCLSLLILPAALAETGADRIFCPCSGCDHPGFTKLVSACGCPDAAQIKQEIATLESRGKTISEIEDVFVARFGDKALAKPRPKGFGLAAVLVGPLSLLAGLVVIVLVARRWKAGTDASSAPDAPLSNADEEKVRLALQIEIEMDRDRT